MQTIRSNLSKLKTLATKELPEGTDLFGYAGIGKEMIISFIDEAHSLSYTLVEMESKFEVIVLKRKISGLIDECKKYLHEDVTGWSKEKKFDGFLNNLTAIRDQIRLTYLVVIDKGLRTEEITNSILEENKALGEASNEYKEKLSTIADISNSVDVAYKTAAESSDKIATLLAQSEKSGQEISNRESEIEASFDLVTKFEDEIRQKREYIANTSEKAASLEFKSSTLLQEITETQESAQQISEQLAKQIEVNKSYQQEIQDTIEGANRKGMAGSFKSRKDELNTPIRIWGGVFVFAIFAIFLIGYHFLSPYISSNVILDRADVVIKIALVSPFVWLAWMSVKQYGYLSRIQEDYAYKFASAMAFEGYKKQAKEIDEDLLKQLLAVSVENLSQNPIRLFNSNDNHASRLVRNPDCLD